MRCSARYRICLVSCSGETKEVAPDTPNIAIARWNAGLSLLTMPGITHAEIHSSETGEDPWLHYEDIRRDQHRNTELGAEIF